MAHLEKKLNDLVNLLGATKGQEVENIEQQDADALSASSRLPVPQASHLSVSPFDLPHREDAFLLLEFRTAMVPQFPFVVIPPEATSKSLRRDRPVLWKAILTAASCHNPPRQEAMGRDLMEEFTKRLLLGAEKSLDLLQALLVHLAWSVSSS